MIIKLLTINSEAKNWCIYSHLLDNKSIKSLFLTDLGGAIDAKATLDLRTQIVSLKALYKTQPIHYKTID